MKKFYITTAIAYTNAPPHIGFALELIQADALARYHRQQGAHVFFLTGTDEHGTKVVQTANALDTSPQELADTLTPLFEQLTRILNCSNDDFIRTTDRKRHWPGVQQLWKKLDDAGALYKDTYRGYYCVGCEAYLAESDLDDGLCPIHHTEPELLEEENYFFKLSKYQEQIKKHIEQNKLHIVPESRRNELLSLIEHEGLNDISFSRPREKLPWGIPVPGDEDHTIYVWADALPNYITAIGYGNDGSDSSNQTKTIPGISVSETVASNFDYWWPADVHAIGKDILRFHAAIWPAMLLAAGLPLPRTIFTHGFITAGGEKMSKSKGNVVNPVDLVERFGVDAVRYYLLREIPTTGDGDYSDERFVERYNADLANGVGNLVSRVIAMIQKYEIDVSFDERAETIDAAHQQTQTKRDNAIETYRLHEALAAIWEFIAACDRYIEDHKPWELAKNEQGADELRHVLSVSMEALRRIADLLQPFLPLTAERIARAVERHTLEDPLFPRIE